MLLGEHVDLEPVLHPLAAAALVQRGERVVDHVAVGGVPRQGGQGNACENTFTRKLVLDRVS